LGKKKSNYVEKKAPAIGTPQKPKRAKGDAQPGLGEESGACAIGWFGVRPPGKKKGKNEGKAHWGVTSDDEKDEIEETPGRGG